ncbi:MAG: glutathione binding-like protein [Pseudomonadota bacterium]
MKLYYKPGACSMATHILLNEIGDPFELERVDTKRRETETGANYLDINPRGYVPAVMLGNGETLTENAAILQYIFDERFGNTSEINAFGRARLQEVLSFLSSELHKAFSPFFANSILTAEERADALAKLHRQLSNFEAMIADGRAFMLGAQYTPADAYAFVILNWATFISVSLDEWPNAKAFYERVKARPATRKALVREGLLKGEAA